ncbi:MAG: lytic murein transglycosylase B [Pseudomonadota bacterium]
MVRFVLGIFALLCASTTFALDLEREDVRAFIDSMVAEHNYERSVVESILADAEIKPKILETIARPAERTLTWADYRPIFMTEERVNAGAKFLLEHRDELERIASETGVPTETIVAIIGVETYYGRITGGHRVVDALATLAFDYPPRSKFFRSELVHFLLLVREEGMDASDAFGSYAGAMGRPQFMPSSYRAYAVDSTGDGKRDIWGNWTDVAGSVANYFVEHGWKPGGPVTTRATLSSRFDGELPKNSLKATATVQSLSDDGVVFDTQLAGDAGTTLLTLEGADGTEHWVGFHNFFVITRYNRSVMYALAVHQLAQDIALKVADEAA